MFTFFYEKPNKKGVFSLGLVCQAHLHLGLILLSLKTHTTLARTERHRKNIKNFFSFIRWPTRRSSVCSMQHKERDVNFAYSKILFLFVLEEKASLERVGVACSTPPA